MACYLAGAKPLSESVLENCKLDPWDKFKWNLKGKVYIFFQENVFENVV